MSRNNHCYFIFEEILFHPDLGEYTTYGIRVDSNNSDSEFFSVSDVYTSKNNLLLLVQRCNEFQLYPVHLPDVINDFFAMGL